MDYGVHLPLLAFDGKPYSLKSLQTYTSTAAELGFQAVSANDHLVFSRPWLDGPAALAAVLGQSGHMTVATTVSLPVIRGPVPLAKVLAAIDILSEGRLVVGVGPGSSPSDYAAAGLPFEERWQRFDEAISALRILLGTGAESLNGNFYSTQGIALEPRPIQAGGPPIWIGSWGSKAGLRRTARLGDGWLASAYNTTPRLYAQAWVRLNDYLREAGRDPSGFPNAIATMWSYVTEDRGQAEAVIREILGPAINRPEDELKERVLIGSAAECAEKLQAYKEAGAQRVFLWPVADELHQLELFQAKVVPLVES
ncbi:MAG: LLM class flavin-dependent oxidoreductase [Gammaproteobacteria bacterium]